VFAEPNWRSETATSKQLTSQQIKNNIFNLSDQQMKNAIRIGNGGIQSVTKFQASQRLSIVDDQMKSWQPAVSVATPYYYITVLSFSAFSKYEEYTLADAKMTKKEVTNLNQLGFSVLAYGDNAGFAKNIDIIFKQGSKVLQPVRVVGLNKLADSTGDNSPAYMQNFVANFDIKKIDFSKPADLIYMYAGKEMSVTYRVDFSKIK
jgi:hypothetical protein